MRIVALVVVSSALAATGCGGSSHVTPPHGATGAWSPAVNLPAPAPPQTAEAVVRPDGSAIAVWAQHLKGAGARLLAAERSPEGVWAAGVPVAPDSPTPIRAAHVVVDSAGAATAAWSVWDRPQGAVFAFVQAARQRPDGRWDAAVTLSRGTNGLFDIAMTAPAAGRVVVAWSGSEARNGAYFPGVNSAFRSPDGRWSFASVAGRLKGDPGLEAGSLGSVGTTGTARLIWVSLPARGFPGGVLTATAQADGRWSDPERLSDEGEQPGDFSVSSAPDTSMVAVWRRRGNGQPRATRAVGAAWTTPRDLPGGPVTEGPALVAGPHGSALVALQRKRGERSVLQTLRVGPNGIASAPRDIDARAVPPAVGTSGRFPLAWDPALAMDLDGRALIAWARSRQRSDGAVVSNAITARVAAPHAKAWGKPETVARFRSPVVGVLPHADALSGGAFAMRWSEGGVDPNPGSRQSIRSP